MPSGPGEGVKTPSDPPLSDWTGSSQLTAPRLAPGETSFTPGTMLAGRYRIVALLGKGGMGEIYRADDVKLGQPVALKFLHGALSPERLQQLYAEVRIGRQVSHPNVCRLYDVVELGGHTFLAMEYVDGEDLASLLGRIGRLPPDKAIEIARDLCAGLAAVHDKGVVHRDLKPANVMIDGRGRARLTDFGLALAYEAQGRAAYAGTPAYMSPEQLAGREATARSDLFAMGLLLYEMLTGRRFFDARTVGELQEQHRQAKAPRLQAGPRLLDPDVEGAILRCLEDDPGARPASARALIALLPGGDPLEAAVAAGETPSPEQVAAAGTVGDLAPWAAWTCLLATLGGLGLNAYLADRATLLGKASPPKPPQVLVERAKETVARLGYRDEPADHASSFEWDLSYLRHVAREDRSPGRWERLRTARPGPILFFYRQSPQKLVALNRDAMVLRDDPPMSLSGMVEVVLDARGRLTSFVAVPPQFEESQGPWPEPDWSPLFEEAGLEKAAFEPTPPRWAAPVDSDRKTAWAGAFEAGAPVRIEAAAYHGRPVWFEVLPPWTQQSRMRDSREPVSRTPVAQAGVLVLALAMPLGGVLLARRNLRLGRGDRKGALRLALYVFIAFSIARLLRADHVRTFGEELWILIKVFAYPSFWAIQVWLLYIALEPYARRRWPRMLISWKRLLGGSLRDPLVGRDVLLGCVVGSLEAIVFRLGAIAPTWWGEAPLMPDVYLTGPMISALRQVAVPLFVNQFSAVLYALTFLFILVLMRVILRNHWLAFVPWLLLVGSPLRGEDPAVEWTFGVLRAMLMLLVLTRGGLLAFAASLFFMFNIREAPLTLDLGAWYAAQAVPALVVLGGLAVYGFHTSLGGKSPFGRALLED